MVNNIWFKLIVLAVAVHVLTGCGIPKQMAKDCGGDLEQGCRQLFGDVSNDEEHEADQNAAINDVRNRVAQLETNYLSTVSSLNVIHAAITALSSEGADHDATLLTLEASLVSLQSQANNNQAAITALQLQDSVIDYLDCGGDGPGYDEVVLRTRSGKLVAYFESGSQRFLSVLVPGSYQTTDSSHCPFTVNNSMKFCDSLGCR